MKKFVAIIMTFLLTLSLIFPYMGQEQEASAKAYNPNEEYNNLVLRFWNDEKPNQRFYINAASRYILETVKEPKMGSTYGEWSVMGLLRGMYTGSDYINYIPKDYFSNYVEGINTYVVGKSGVLDKNKSTEWSRLTLSMTSLGIPITNIAGYDFVDRLAQSHKFSSRQGINGPIWEIIALNTAGYQFPETPSIFSEGDINTVGKMIDYIIGKEITTTEGVKGGWALSGKNPDPDITGMALQALAPYYLDETKYPNSTINTTYIDFKKAVERAILAMSAMQKPGGGFNAFGNVNAESTSQVIVALAALNIDPKTKSVNLPTIGETALFNQQAGVNDGVSTDNMIDMLLTFFSEGSGSSPEVSGFKHITSGYDGGGGSGTGVNAMATDQALYGLIAYDRFVQKQKSLYDMTDQSAGQYKATVAKKQKVIFNTKGEESTKELSPYATIKIPVSSPTSNEKVITWNSKEDGSGAVYLPTEVLVIPEQDITLYAQFGENNYNITYELNAGKFTGEVINHYVATEQTVLPTSKDIEREGYTFVGWYDNAEFVGKAITLIEKGSSSNKKYFAKWVDENALTNEVITLISNLPTTISEKDALVIETIRAAYTQLTVKEQLNIVNYGKLLDAEMQLDKILNSGEDTINDEEIAQKMIAIIDELPVENTITLQHQSIIAQARTYYNSLSVKQKMYISNYSKLLKVEKAFAVVEGEEIDVKSAQQIMDEIKKIPAVDQLTLADEELIQVVRTAYDVSTMKQQTLVTTYNKLVQAELKLELLKNDEKLKVNTVKNSATTISGTTLPNETVTVYSGGEKLSTTTATNKGIFSLKIEKQKAGTKLVVKTSDATKTITVETSKTLATPKANTVGAKSVVITGTATKATTITATVTGKKIGTAKVSSKGAYSIKIAAQKKGTVIELVIKDSLNNVSKAKKVTVVASKTLATPKANTVGAKSVVITGTATKATTITATVKGKKIGTAKVSSKGAYSIKIAAQKKGTVIELVTKDSLNNVSKAKKVTVIASKTLAKPKVNKVTTKTTKISGTATKSTTITVYTNAGKKVASAKVSSKGKYSLKIKKQKKKTVLKIRIKDRLNNTSSYVKVTVY
ncbi:MAG: InlB B-repeat-containing protein [Kurthia sp.]|nr:InlB B-repeat-containing protein [Candidatus Kurthia equi]